MLSRSRLPVLVSCSVLTVWTAGTAHGQSGTLQKRLAAATSLRCTFSVMAGGTWKGGTPSADIKTATLTVAFTSVNVDEGTAVAEGRFGSAFIVVRYSGDYLHLMQMHSSGPLYTTTVLAKESRDGRLLAVHTRHEYTDVSLPGFTSRPEMYLGECVVA
jgi:hypothetical protein